MANLPKTYDELVAHARALLHSQRQANGLVYIACSGGPDSMLLMRVMSDALGSLASERMVVCHLNYRLRPGDSDLDEALVKSESTRLGLSYRVLRIGEGAAPHSGIQDWARKIRYDWFYQQLHPDDVICFGHHSDDLCENVLFRLVRAHSFDNLLGMKPVHGQALRPFLTISSHEIRKFCSRHNVPSRFDVSNDKLIYNRNRIRHEVVPVLASIQPLLSQKLMEHAECYDALVAWFGDQMRQSIDRERGLDLEWLASLHPALRKLAVVEFLSDSSPISHDLSEVILDCLGELDQRALASVNLPDGGVLQIEGKFLTRKVSHYFDGRKRSKYQGTLHFTDWHGRVLANSVMTIHAEFDFVIENDSSDHWWIEMQKLDERTSMKDCAGVTFDPRKVFGPFIERGSCLFKILPETMPDACRWFLYADRKLVEIAEPIAGKPYRERPGQRLPIRVKI